MPYASRAQAAYFNIHKADMERQGVDVDEWNAASKGMKLPEHAKKKAAPKERVAKALAGYRS